MRLPTLGCTLGSCDIRSPNGCHRRLSPHTTGHRQNKLLGWLERQKTSQLPKEASPNMSVVIVLNIKTTDRSATLATALPTVAASSRLVLEVAPKCGRIKRTPAVNPTMLRRGETSTSRQHQGQRAGLRLSYARTYYCHSVRAERWSASLFCLLRSSRLTPSRMAWRLQSPKSSATGRYRANLNR